MPPAPIGAKDLVWPKLVAYRQAHIDSMILPCAGDWLLLRAHCGHAFDQYPILLASYVSGWTVVDPKALHMSDKSPLLRSGTSGRKTRFPEKDIEVVWRGAGTCPEIPHIDRDERYTVSASDKLAASARRGTVADAKKSFLIENNRAAPGLFARLIGYA
jgi:hypothetical protein